MSERFVDFVDVFNDCLYVVICRVFAFYDLDLSSAAVCEVFDYLALLVAGEAHRPDEVWLVVFWSKVRV